MNDEIQSLRQLCSKNIYQEILKELHEYCNINIDQEILEETIEYWKQQPKTSYGYYIENTVNENEEQREYIQQMFENGIDPKWKYKKIEKKEEIDYDRFVDDMMIKVYNSWWIDSFLENTIKYYGRKKDNASVVLYYEFITKKSNIDYSLGKCAKQFLEFVYEKYNISKEIDKILKQIVYKNFIKGCLFIEESEIKKYENKYPEIMKELYKSNLIINENGKYYFINKYIYLYIAIQEIDRKDDNLIEIIEKWEMDENYNEYIYDNIMYMEERVLQIYSEINREKFNRRYAYAALQFFVNEVQKESKTKGKMGIARTIIDMFSWEIELDEKFEMYSQFNCTYDYVPILNFVIGIFIESDITRLEYAIYQKQLYKKCYDSKKKKYILDFKKILKDKELREICSSIKVWDYLYDIYKESIKALEELEKDIKTDMYNIAKNRFFEKYYK